VGQVGNLRPIGNRPYNFLAQYQADYQSAAGYQPAPHMKSLFRPSTPADSARLIALFAEAFDSPPDSSLFDPAFMAWKYWDARGDWTEPRSFVLEKDGRIIAHAGLWPATFGEGLAASRGVQMIDWASAKDSPGAGLTLVQKFARMFDFIYSIGGSEATRQVLPAFGFVELTRTWIAARPLRPFRQILSHQHRNWKLGPRLIRNWSWSNSPAMRASSGWKVAPLNPADISVTADSWFCPRNAAFFEYFLRCPVVQYRLYGIANESGPQGHFALGTLRGQARLSALSLRNAGLESLRNAYTLAQQTALGLTDAYEIAVSGTVGIGGNAAVEAGLRVIHTTPVYFFSQHGKFAFPENFQFQLSDDDAAFLDIGAVAFYT
jgi:hypothetical protein